MKDRMLIAVGINSVALLAAESEPMNSQHGDPRCSIMFEIEEGEPCLWDQPINVPEEKGFYIWEGSVYYTGGTDNYCGDDDDPEVHWNGEWRKATKEDFDHFGIKI